jgi:hypothetical protein
MSDLTVTLRGAAADKLRKLMAEEGYAKAEDAVEGALDALDDSRAPEIDAWLRGVISARADAFAADPSRAMTPDQVRKSLFGKV